MPRFRICPDFGGWKVQSKWLGVFWRTEGFWIGYDAWSGHHFDTEAEAEQYIRNRLERESINRTQDALYRARARIQPREFP